MWNTYSQFDWLKFLSLARDLRTRTEEEAIRTSVSRAYYATYHKALEFLDSRSIAVSRVSASPAGVQAGTSHDALWRTFSRSQDRRWQKIGEDGDRLKRKRQMVDYDSYVHKLVPDVADEALLVSQRIVDTLAQL
jgi:uncharacterized protein (UPF0332 family)